MNDNPWAEWREKAKVPAYGSKRLQIMHNRYGKSEGNTCGNCAHFLRIQFSRTYFKCDLTNMSHSAATDWHARWPACGKFEAGKQETILAPK